MDDPLLTALCTICHIDDPIYTCPRCLAATCSLTCSKRHKIWSSCNGVRDPTVYRPMSQLATPSGIDHDYNFLHGIEHGISRSEKVLVEDLSLVTREELNRARLGDRPGIKRPRQKHEVPGEACIRQVMEERNIILHKAPKGMRRNKENTTSWNRKRKTVDWQVEWLRLGQAGRALYKVAGNRPIAEQYEQLCEEERRLNMTEEERRELKKRRADEVKERATKRCKLDESLATWNTLPAALQDATSRAWSLSPISQSLTPAGDAEISLPDPPLRTYFLYLHRPLTPASFPTVLVPMDPAAHLTDILVRRHLLEFPTVYVLPHSTANLPAEYMLEADFLIATRPPLLVRHDRSCSRSSTSSDSSSSSDTSDDLAGNS